MGKESLIVYAERLSEQIKDLEEQILSFGPLGKRGLSGKDIAAVKAARKIMNKQLAEIETRIKKIP